LATKPASPRTAKSPMMASGIDHSGSAPPVKPLSSSGCISAGMSGSVSAPTRAAAPAAASAPRAPAKWGDTREKRASNEAMRGIIGVARAKPLALEW